MTITNIAVCGIGGQGVMTATEILAEAALSLGFDVKKTEVAGMSQRGGVVTSHLRFGPKVLSPQIMPGDADLLVGFEAAEALRWAHMLKPGGIALVNQGRFVPPVVTSASTTTRRTRSARCASSASRCSFDASALAMRLGNIRLGNTVMLGAMSDRLPFPPTCCWPASTSAFARKGEKVVEANRQAFEAGACRGDAEAIPQQGVGADMTARIIDGNALSAQVRGELAERAAALKAKGVTPCLAVILVGEDPASAVYVRNKVAGCEKAGMRSLQGRVCTRRRSRPWCFKRSPSSTPTRGAWHPGATAAAEALRRDRRARSHFAGEGRRRLPCRERRRLMQGNPRFIPCTPYGVMKMLESARCRSRAPKSWSSAAATSSASRWPCCCWRRAAPSPSAIRSRRTSPSTPAAPTSWWPASAAAKMITGDMIKPGATVIDVGINRLAGRPRRRQAVRRRRFRVGQGSRRRHHPGARRRRPDDHHHAAGQHAGSRERKYGGK
jgi:indolepyruvate ferredoxin oxidoreductase beta subunit